MMMTSVIAVPRETLPALITGAGNQAARRFVEFFTVNIRNKNTRAAYARAAGAFLRWCEARGLADLRDVQPVHVAAYVETLQRANALNANAVPWLLLKATSATSGQGAGTFARVTYIQRVDIEGGLAPATGCDSSHAGAEAPADYQATYFFCIPRA